VAAEGRAALIVGASSPLGTAIGDALAAEGWSVSRCGRADSVLPAGAPGGDLCDPEVVRALAEAVRADPPDLLVWAASRFAPAPYERRDALSAFALSALAPFEVGLAHLEGAVAAGRMPTQIHLADLAGDEPFLQAPAYSLGRGAGRVALRLLQRRAPADASVIVLRLGIVDVAGRDRRAEQGLAERDAVLGRRARVDEVLAAVRTVLARPSAFRGAWLDVDGGLALRTPSRRPVGPRGE
jgi:NAD(P)-dependent dehydrogenase (short-subunit alcohol dehydrogenase family)